MALFQSFNIAGSGMTAERFRMDTIAENIANVNTTHSEDGSGPYRRKIVTFEERSLNPSFSSTLEQYRDSFKGNGVRVASVSDDTSTDFIMDYDPSNPDADQNGYVRYPNVNTVTEMTNLIDATRAYQANVTVFNGLKSSAQQGIAIGNS
ncbi:MAG: flagellar basal body rod protein FlgC [Lachnospiraceae bacterium]|nr:flagellar basal body rod protein FlgC [Lachnospiraceae bacterium]MDD7327977.1 flagellar basal body rod protein FlgC [Lachnospiraceae bacterium]MDY2760412.1 flagellar basal body rod protein FlgC [Lachnospiraceae bacterium]